MRRPLLLLAAIALAAPSCGGDSGSAAESPTTLFPPDYTVPPSGPTTTAAPSTTTTSTLPLPSLPSDGVTRALVTPSGITVAVHGGEPGTWLVTTPCGNEAVVAAGEPVVGAHVVVDPGHGGEEAGAVGPGGLLEKDVNLAVAAEVEAILESEGVSTVLTRTGDYRITLASRAAIATSLGAEVFVSIHHNADPDGPREQPGTETYYQVDDPASKRLAGLVYEDLVAAFSAYEADWVGDTDAGAKYRLNQRGTDYYGILRHSAGVPAVLVEALFITNPSEEALLADPAVRSAEAQAIARAVRRFLTTDDPGSGFVEPYERVEPAGPGGGSAGCEDPPLG